MNGITNAFWQLFVLFAPLVLCVFCLRWIEGTLQKRMTRHFGWRSNLWTGWIGAPVHEYSHALVAKLFGHKVLKIVPFQPDEKTGRLGYVVIQYNRQSRWQTIGHFFVCYAPLFGGTLVLFLLTALFYPEALSTSFTIPEENLFSGSFSQAMNQLGVIVTLEHLGQIKFWIFSYLVLAIGCHLAPSSEDHKSSLRSKWLMAFVALVVTVVLGLLGGFSDSIFSAIAPMFLVLQANFFFAALLCGMVLLIVYIITELMIWLS